MGKPRVASEFDDYDFDVGGISTNNAARNNNRPKFSGKIFIGGIKVVHVVLNDTDKDRNALVIAMDISGDEQHALFSVDEFGNEYYCMATCVGINTEETDGVTSKFGYVFQCDDPTWIEVKEVVDLWSITADEETHSIVVGGNQIARPVFEIVPGAPVGYYPYTRYIKNYNPIEVAQTDLLDITNGGWDTATLVTAGKMRADGFDVRVFMDGAEIPRWFGGGGMNSATTKIFIRGVWKPGQNVPLRTALPNTDTAAKIQWVIKTVQTLVKKKKVVTTVLSKLPKSGIVRVDNEEISYTNLNPVLCEADIVSREIRGTTIGAHSVGAATYWVEHDIKIIHGDGAAEEPIYDDTYKPIVNLTTSTNTSRVYAVFADSDNLQVGSFIRQVIYDGLGKLNRVYSSDKAAIPESDPAVTMGMEIASYQVQGRAKPETATLAWQLYHPANITTVTVTGEKFKSFATTTWPLAAELASSVNGVAWVREWNELAPASANTWTPLTNTAAETIPAGRPYIRFCLNGSVNALNDNFARMEIDSATVVLNSSNVIQVGMSAEIANYQFLVTILNQRTGEQLFIDYPAEQGVPFIVDTDQMAVTYKGMNAIRGISWDTVRTDWLKLEPGENILQYFADPTAAIALTTRIHNRAA